MLQRKRTKKGGDVTSEIDAIRDEELDSSVQDLSRAAGELSYASMLQNTTDRFSKAMVDDFEICDEDCFYSPGKHGLNVSFSEKVHNKLDLDWRYAVVVKLMGKPNSTNTFDFMLRGLRRKWQVKGGWKLIDLPNDFFIVKFNLEEDMNHALCAGPWILAGQTLTVQKWSPEFNPVTDVIGKMALWVRICGLPVKYFRDFAIPKIGKIIGEVVKVDPITLGQARGKFARICIEVDLSKPLKPFVEVESVAYNVVYEGISLICFECGCYGHAKDKCPTIVQAAANNVEENTPDATDDGSTGGVVGNHMDEGLDCSRVVKEDMGPWMLMSYRTKKKGYLMLLI